GPMEHACGSSQLYAPGFHERGGGGGSIPKLHKREVRGPRQLILRWIPQLMDP
ncbi:Hypothetical protein FKW44_016661, partial [Caligus rogercresseyi]